MSVMNRLNVAKSLGLYSQPTTSGVSQSAGGSGLRISLQLDKDSAEQLKIALRGLPDRIERNVLRYAGRKAAKHLEGQIKTRTPVQQRATKQSKTPHLRDLASVRQKSYRKSKNASITYFAVGWKSKPNAHLVEYGTSARYTNSRTKYAEVGTKQIKTKKGWFTKRKRKSIGSFAKGGPQVYRGIMPAFRPTHRAFSESGATVRETMLSEIKNRLQTELSKNATTMRATFGSLR